MFSRPYISIGLALLLALAFVIPVSAGGWAVITLDELPTDVVAGEPLTIRFSVRQHGVTLLDGLTPTVTARLPFDENFSVYAKPDGEPGHYTATLTFPQEGNWEWSIHAFIVDQPMPLLVVSAPGTQFTSRDAENNSSSAAISVLWVVRMLALGIALASLVLVFRRSRRLAMALTGLCLLVGAGTFLPGVATSEVAAQSKSSSSSISQVEFGRQLFIAKGCITCHHNSRAGDSSEYHTIEIGAPNLSNYSSHPDILFIRLKDPAAAKSDTKMPDLGLQKMEIEALIAFINSK